MPQALAERVLAARVPFVIAGTHGKTTTTTLTAYLLRAAGMDAGFFIGGIPLNFDRSSRLGSEGAPFVIEGDEYDSAFFEKTPKFWAYRPSAAILTSIEYDHIDIYPNETTYLNAFREFVRRIPPEGWLFAWAGAPRVRPIHSNRMATTGSTFVALRAGKKVAATPATKRITVAAPVTMSPPAQTPFLVVLAVFSSTSM